MTEESIKESQSKGPILHVIVVGFHHKKGCQVEYSFPPLVEGAPYDSNECPPGWHYLPTLALPDGSHNFEEDTVYFHLPSLKNPRQTIFGVSCFRQIPVEKLTNRTSDITRGTVQKSVCVLSTLPLYGHIQVKMSLITHAYFEEGDFSKVKLLQDTYTNLNSCLSPEMLDSSQAFVGLSLRDLVLQFKHKALLLFKLLLLERRVLFFRSPVQQLCATILSLLSLHPGMLERGGLNQAACVRTSRPMSPMPRFDSELEKSPPMSPVNVGTTMSSSVGTTMSSSVGSMPHSASQSSLGGRASAEQPDTCDISPGTMEETDAARASLSAVVSMVNTEKCGLPLALFTKGYLCHPYLSLPYMDMLSDVNVRGYVIGATNVLFKQKRQLADVLVEIEDTRVEASDPELRRQLHLTTEDLRFADYIVRHVAEERHDVFLDGVGWEGGDEWIRAQFRVYLLCLMRTCLLEEGSRELEHFNSSYVSAWRGTHNFKIWSGGEHDAILEVPPGHPCAGQLSVADMKLRLSHTMQNTEGGRKVTQAMASTGRAVAHTGRAVGGALTQAKGAFSNWWSTLTTAQNAECAETGGEEEEANYEEAEPAVAYHKNQEVVSTIKQPAAEVSQIKPSNKVPNNKLENQEVMPVVEISNSLLNSKQSVASKIVIKQEIVMPSSLSITQVEPNTNMIQPKQAANKVVSNQENITKPSPKEDLFKQAPINQVITASADSNKKVLKEEKVPETVIIEKKKEITKPFPKEESIKQAPTVKGVTPNKSADSNKNVIKEEKVPDPVIIDKKEEILPEIKKLEMSKECDEKVDLERTSLR